MATENPFIQTARDIGGVATQFLLQKDANRTARADAKARAAEAALKNNLLNEQQTNQRNALMIVGLVVIGAGLLFIFRGRK